MLYWKQKDGLGSCWYESKKKDLGVVGIESKKKDLGFVGIESEMKELGVVGIESKRKECGSEQKKIKFFHEKVCFLSRGINSSSTRGQKPRFFLPRPRPQKKSSRPIPTCAVASNFFLWSWPGQKIEITMSDKSNRF